MAVCVLAFLGFIFVYGGSFIWDILLVRDSDIYDNFVLGQFLIGLEKISPNKQNVPNEGTLLKIMKIHDG